MGYVQIDPEKTRALATVLAQQSLAADASASRISAALTLSGLVSTVPARLAGRSDDWLLMAAVLQQRATEAESFILELGSEPFAVPATSVELSERFDGVLVASYERPPTPAEAYEADVARFDDLVDAIESWPGTDNDPLFDAMVNERDELFAYLTAGLDLDLIAAIWAQTNEGVEFIDAARQAMADREARVASASETIGALLHVDDQSGLSPWADGDAEVTVEEVEAVFAALGGLNDAEAALVWQTIDPEALERLLHVMETGHEAGADNPWGHTAWAAPRWIGRFGEAAVVETWNATVTVGEAFVATGMAYAYGNGRPPVGGQALPDEVWRVSAAGAAGADVIAAGNVPFATNYVRCTTGDGSACFMLGFEVSIEVVGGFVVGRVASVIGRAGNRLVVRFVTRNGDEQIIAISEEIAARGIRNQRGLPIEFDDAGRVIPDAHGQIPAIDLDNSDLFDRLLRRNVILTRDPNWELPPGWAKPAPGNGSWENGVVANSDWTPNDPARWGLEPGDVVPFHNGTPDFYDYLPDAMGNPNLGPAEVHVAFTGNRGRDVRNAVRAFAEKFDVSIEQAEAWITANKLEMHHFDCVAQWVPKATHNIHHQGTVANINNGVLSC